MPIVKEKQLITEKTLNDLFLQNKKKFLGYLYSQGCFDYQDQEDIINDALLNVWINRSKFKGDCSLNSWVVGSINLNKINFLTNKQRHQRRVNGLKELNTVMSETYELKQTNDALAARLVELSPRTKQIMELVLQDYSNHEIAKELNISYDTVKVTYLNGIKYLRKFKKEY